MALGVPEIITIALTGIGSGGLVQIVNTFFTGRNESRTVATLASEKALNMLVVALDRADVRIRDLEREMTEVRGRLNDVQDKNVVLEAELMTLRASQGGNNNGTP